MADQPIVLPTAVGRVVFQTAADLAVKLHAPGSSGAIRAAIERCIVAALSEREPEPAAGWTRELPTEPGWYWLYVEETHKQIGILAVEVTQTSTDRLFMLSTKGDRAPLSWFSEENTTGVVAWLRLPIPNPPEPTP